MSRKIFNLSLAVITVATSLSVAAKMTLTSSDIGHGEFMSNTQVFNGFGCKGENQSPALTWSNAPDGTKAFAVLAYDPDAPTGSGWWHWQVINLPANATSLPTNAGTVDGNLLPKGSQQMENDFGYKGFGGACPPVGDGAHRYQFTVHALSSTLDLPAEASAALTGYMVHANTIETATIEALYKR